MNAINRANMAMSELSLNQQRSKIPKHFDGNNSENNPNLVKKALNTNTTNNNSNSVIIKASRDDSNEKKLLKAAHHKQKAKSCAMKGNEHACAEEFEKAIEKFTEAIKYDPLDHRLYGNRSFCYEKLNKFQEALDDAEKAISIDLDSRKGYYRKGKALVGLKRYREAEQAYLRLFELDESVEPELEDELVEVRVLQLQEMGFSRAQAENAFKKCSTIEEAILEILKFNATATSTSDHLKYNNSNYSGSDDFNDDDDDDEASCDSFETSDSESKTSKQENNEFLDHLLNENNNEDEVDNEDDFKLVAPPSKKYNSNKQQQQQADKNKPQSDTSSSADQTELQASSSLWVGNVDPSVTEKELIDLFSPFGTLLNVRSLPEKYCAFINYRTKDEAAKAMQTLQGKLLENQRLLIKYPDNPNSAVINLLKSHEYPAIKLSNKSAETAKKTDPILKQVKVESNSAAVKSSSSSEAQQQQQQLLNSKLTGPVNGNECYFWRTTGCIYADKCRYEHIKKNKGIDKKAWHKN